MKKIICPKCGEVEFYTNFDIQKVFIAFDAEGKKVDIATEPIELRNSIIPRCFYCGSKVKIVEQK